LFIGETRPFYFRRPCLAETGFDGLLAIDLANSCRSAEEVRDRLRALGFTHLLYDPNAWRTDWARTLNYFRFRDEASRCRFSELLTRLCRPVYRDQENGVVILEPKGQ